MPQQHAGRVDGGPALTPEFIDEHLERVMKASGSSLRHYEDFSKNKMRIAMIDAMLAALKSTGAE